MIPLSLARINTHSPYKALIIRNDHPHFSQVVQQFTLTVQILSQKSD